MIKMKWRKYSKSVRIDNTFMVIDNEKNTYLFLWQMRNVTIPFGAWTQRGAESQGGGGITSFNPLKYATVYTHSSFLSFLSIFHFPNTSFFSPAVLYLLPNNYRIFLTENSMVVVGKQVKDCWGKNEGLGKMNKREDGFPPSYFFPKSSVFIFFPSSTFSP